jgi:predicted MFS family arabinose efflux permease
MSRRWQILAALTFARTSMGFQFQSVAALAPFVTAELGLDNAQLGWLVGIYLLPGIVIALPGGLLGARYGDKRMVLIGLALMTGGGLWLARAASPLAADAARIASGAGAVMLNVLLTKMVADWFDGKERILAMSILINAWPIGIGVALFALGPLGQAIGWRAAILAACALAAFGFAAVLFFYRAPPSAAPAAPTGIGIEVLDAREWRLLAIASIPWLVYNAAYQIVVSFLPSFLGEGGASIARSGAMTAINTALLIASVQAGGVLLKRSAHPDWICHAAVAASCASLLLLSTSSLPWLWIIAAGIVGGLPAGAFVNLPAEFLRPQSRGPGMGVFYTVYYVGCAILPAAAGRLSDLAGSTRATLWFAALLAFLCIPTLALFRRALPGRRPAPA